MRRTSNAGAPHSAALPTQGLNSHNWPMIGKRCVLNNCVNPWLLKLSSSKQPAPSGLFFVCVVCGHGGMVAAFAKIITIWYCFLNYRLVKSIPSHHQLVAAPARWSTGVERWEGFKGRLCQPAQGAMKVMPLHRKGWGNRGLEPGNREQLDRKPEPCVQGCGLIEHRSDFNERKA